MVRSWNKLIFVRILDWIENEKVPTVHLNSFHFLCVLRIGECKTVSVAPKPAKSTLVVDKVYFYAKNNATEHKTVRFELVHREPETAILRRGQPFTFIIRFAEGKSFDPAKDILRLHFNLGESCLDFVITQWRELCLWSIDHQARRPVLSSTPKASWSSVLKMNSAKKTTSGTFESLAKIATPSLYRLADNLAN